MGQIKSRDNLLDGLRALAMLEVIFVHILYWTDIFPDGYQSIIKSFFLFEMPLFFFITGACNSYNKDVKYLDFVIRRLKRIMIPYWIYAAVCIVIIFIYSFFIANTGITPIEAVKMVGTWLAPIVTPISPLQYLAWALWFMPVYVGIIFVFPVLIKMYNSKYKHIFIVVLVILYFLSQLIDISLVTSVCFYLIWSYLGMFYNSIKSQIFSSNKKTKVVLLLTSGISMGVLCVLAFCGFTPDMQTNKFPPNTMFFLFSVLTMSLIMLLVPFLKFAYSLLTRKFKILNNFFSTYSKYSLSVFLYQSLVFSVVIPLGKYLFDTVPFMNSDILLMVFYIVVMYPIMAIAARLAGRLEKLKI